MYCFTKCCFFSLLTVLLSWAVYCQAELSANDVWCTTGPSTENRYGHVLDLWGGNSTSIFAVGYKGTILHFNGNSWDSVESGTSDNLNAIFGSSDSDIIAVGDESIFHFDGNSWSRLTAIGNYQYDDQYASPTRVWGNSASNIYRWANHYQYDNGAGATYWCYFEHYDGASWSSVDIPDNNFNQVNKVWGSISGQDVFVEVVYNPGGETFVGTQRFIKHYDGQSWTNIPLPPDWIAHYDSIWSRSGSDIFTIDYDGYIARYDGTSWTSNESGADSVLTDMWINISNNVLVGVVEGTVLHFDGSSWSPVPMETMNNNCPETVPSLSVAWASNSNDFFAIGSNGSIYRYNGDELQLSYSRGADVNLSGVWGDRSNNVVAVGSSGSILHYDGTKWEYIEQPRVNDGISLSDVWGNSSNDIFAVGDNGKILHYNGNYWYPMVSNTTSNFHGVCGSSDSNVYAVGDFNTPNDIFDYYGIGFHFDGSTWSQAIVDVLLSQVSINAVWEDIGGEVYVVGQVGTIFSYWGNTPIYYSYDNQDIIPRVTFYDILGLYDRGNKNIFVVGENGTVVHYDGRSGWSIMESGTSATLYGIWGTSVSNIYAVGENGTIVHFDGKSWSTEDSGNTNSLKAIWGSSDGHIFAVGDNATILHKLDATNSFSWSIFYPAIQGQKKFQKEKITDRSLDIKQQ